MTKRAEFQGHCQICGALQKLPKGGLSLHGYSVRWGFFSGICSGANHLPFEQSKDLIEDAIARALEEAKTKDAWADELNKPAVEARAWCEVYRERKQVRFSGEPTGYVKVQGVIRRAEKPHHGMSFIVTADDGREYYVHSNRASDTELDVATQQNRDHAKYVRGLARQLREYADWQTKRIQNWKPAALIPVPEEVETVHFEGTFSRMTTAFCTASLTRARNLQNAPRTTDRTKVTCSMCLRALASRDKYEAEEKAKAERAAERERKRAEKEAAAEAKRAAKAAK
jgi:hypothetical protein